MMSYVNIAETQARDDARVYRDKLKRALNALADARAVTPGCTPREAVYTEDKVTLFRYRNDTEKNSVTPANAGVQHRDPDPDLHRDGRRNNLDPDLHRDGRRNNLDPDLHRDDDRRTLGPAIIICYALINRPAMMDLQEDRSLIRSLLDNGLDVFLIEWGSPDGSDRYLELNDYVNRYLHHCVLEVQRIRGEGQVNLVGVCQGGTLALCYAALHPERVRNLVTMVTPID